MSISISGSGGITGATTSYSFDQSVSIGGTLTYEDVTNIDSVGIITAQSGIRVTGGALVIGGTDSSAKLNVFGGDIQIGTGLTFKSSSSNGNLNLQGGYTYPGGWIKLSGGSSDDNIVFGTSSNNAIKEERLRIDSSGRLLINTNSSTTVWGYGDGSLQLMGDYQGASASFINNEANTNSHAITLAKTRNGSILQNGDTFGAIVFSGDDSNGYHAAARIIANVDGTPSDNVMPGRLSFQTGGTGGGSPTERLRITSGGFVGINETSPGAQLTVKRANTATSGLSGVLKLKQGSATNGNRASLLFSSLDDFDVAAVNGTILTHSGSTSNNEGRLEFWTKNTGSDIAERVRIQPAGFVQIGSGYLNSTTYHRINGINASGGDAVFVVSGYQTSGGTNQDSMVVSASSDSASPNSSTCILRVFRHAANQRSINAAGSVNASGSDYAEYMVKSGNFTIVKGDICGVNSEGKLTNVFADSISFVVKSTNPSYVGGDTWHTSVGEAPGGYNDNRTESEIAAAKVVYDQNLETARNTVDRIAFAGQVPVNVQGTNAGQYIVPITTADGGITGEAKNEADLTLVEYMRAVGKVIAIEDDGRALIIVKIS